MANSGENLGAAYSYNSHPDAMLALALKSRSHRVIPGLLQEAQFSRVDQSFEVLKEAVGAKEFCRVWDRLETTNPSILEKLLKFKGPHDQTLQHLLVVDDDLQNLQKVAQYLDPEEVGDSGNSILHLCSLPAYHLVKHKINHLQTRNSDLQTPLMRACARGLLELVVEMLFHNPGSSINLQAQDKEGRNLMILAVQSGRPELVHYLTTMAKEWGEKLVDHRDQAGYSPIFHAIMAQNYGITHILCEAGASLEPNRKTCESLVHHAVASLDNRILGLLIDGDCELSDLDQDGNTPLAVCAKHGYWLSAQVLIDAGASLKIANASGQTPLDIAIQLDQTDIRDSLYQAMRDQEISPQKTLSAKGYLVVSLLKIGGLPKSTYFYFGLIFRKPGSLVCRVTRLYPWRDEVHLRETFRFDCQYWDRSSLVILECLGVSESQDFEVLKEDIQLLCETTLGEVGQTLRPLPVRGLPDWTSDDDDWVLNYLSKNRILEKASGLPLNPPTFGIPSPSLRSLGYAILSYGDLHQALNANMPVCTQQRLRPFGSGTVHLEYSFKHKV